MFQINWHRANFVISRADDNMSFLIITFEVALLLLLKNKQTKKEMQSGLTFGLFFTNFYASGPCIYHATSIWRSLHGAYLKHVSELHIFYNGTPCQSETCFRMAHVSERHATHVWVGPTHIQSIISDTTGAVKYYELASNQGALWDICNVQKTNFYENKF